MDSLAQPTPLGVVLAACAVLALALLAVLGIRAARRSRAVQERRERLDAELAGSRAEIATLTRRVEQLADEVVDARRAAQEVVHRPQEFVITSLGDAEPAEVERLVLPSRPVGKVVEEQLVDTLARHRRGSALRTRAVDVAVRTVALGHGVRRALSPDVLDRAAAEAHVARRRSRRHRKREVREARRLLRAVRFQRGARREDAA
jgi:hypothetical protein